jgi:hypothetical protein
VHLRHLHQVLPHLLHLEALVLEALYLMDTMEIVREDAERRRTILEARGRHNPCERFDIHCTYCERNGSHEATNCRVPWEKIKERRNQKEDRGKTSEPTKGKVITHYTVSHCNIGVTDDLFNTSFASWRDAWLLDTGATSHMKFRREFFKDFHDNVDVVVYFVDKESQTFRNGHH